ncbi:MAG: aminoacyl-tRNA hydrolase [Gammaproteobacteria bacterium]|nr:aminoacyl-tRNA hydrolase [Gammaproteobacteria bacterium]
MVGLGNPGAQYARTRHNAGFWFVDALVQESDAHFKPERRYQCEVATTSLNGHVVAIMKPTTFMNVSGAAVAAYANYFRIPVGEILVVHDELDLAPGVVRLKRTGGHGGHNGLREITAQLGAEFVRLRLGIGHPGAASEVVNYVLSSPHPDDRAAIEDAITSAIKILPDIVAGKLDHAMNHLNRRSADPKPAPK